MRRRKPSAFELGEPESTRWYILGLSFYVYAVQFSNWFTFSSIPDKVEDYYHLSNPGDNKVNADIDLLLNWGPILFLPVTPFSAYLLSFPFVGLKYTVRLAATLAFCCSFIRSIPSLLVAFNIGYEINNDFWHTLIFLHLGQILNAIAGPLTMAPPPKLSVIWFPENQRTIATSIGVSACVFGMCLSFLLGPLIGNVATVLYIDLILSFIGFFAVWIYCPEYPSKLPSLAAKDALLSKSMNEISIKENLLSPPKAPNIQNNESDIDMIDDNISFIKHFSYFMFELKELMLNYSAVIVTITGGLIAGLFAGWNGVFQDMLKPLGINAADIGIIGVNFNISSFIGAILFGYIADKWFSTSLRKLIVIGIIIAMFLLMTLLFIIPSPWSDNSMIIINADDSHSYKMIILNILIGLLGLIGFGGLAPLFYELVAGISYPVTEGTSSTLLVFFNNAACLIFVGIGNWLNTKWETFLAVIMCALSIIFMLTIKEEYKRKS